MLATEMHPVTNTVNNNNSTNTASHILKSKQKELDNFLSQFNCSICLEFMDSVFESHCCQVLCCGICHQRCSDCPQCRQKKVSWRKNVALERIIGNLPSSCSNKNCGYTTTRGELLSHRISCPFSQVKCKHTQCSEMMLRKDQESHEKQCKFRIIKCSACKESVVAFKMALHQVSHCNRRIIFCSECGDQLPAFQLNQHKTTACTKRAILCEHCGDYIVAQKKSEHSSICRKPTPVPSKQEKSVQLVECPDCHSMQLLVSLDKHRASKCCDSFCVKCKRFVAPASKSACVECETSSQRFPFGNQPTRPMLLA